MKVAVLFESRTGNTQRAAELIGGAAQSQGAEVSVYPVTRPDYGALAKADFVFIGTWTDGLILVGHRPGGENNLVGLPWLDRKKVGVYITYAVKPGNTIDKLGDLMSAKGADVLESESFHRRKLPDGVDGFVERSLRHL